MQNCVDVVEQIARADILAQVAAPVPWCVEKSNLFCLGLDEVFAQTALLPARNAIVVAEVEGLADTLSPAAVDVGSAMCFTD